MGAGTTRCAKRYRPSRFSSTDDITKQEWVHVLKTYRPLTIRKICTRLRISRWEPWRHKSSGIVTMTGRHLPKGAILRLGRVVLLGGQHGAGKPSVHRYFPDDEFLPVLEFAAHQLARSWRSSSLSSRRIAEQFQINEAIVAEARLSLKLAVPSLIQAFRGLSIPQRTLEEYHHRFRVSQGLLNNPEEERRRLESAIRSYLNESPPRR